LLAGPCKILQTYTPIWWGGPCGPRVGVSPPNIILPGKPTPRSNFCLLAPAQFSKQIPHLVGWTLRPRGWGEPPANKISPGKPTPRSNFCLLAPAQFLTLQGISDGVTTGGTPGGQNFGSPPGLVPSPGEMRSPRQISG
jgi:hypothetical protein